MTKKPKGCLPGKGVGETRAEIARMMLMFKKPVDIAAALGMSRQAVHHHIKRLRTQHEQSVARDLPEHRVAEIELLDAIAAAAPPKPKTKAQLNRQKAGETRAKVAKLLLTISSPRDIAATLGITTHAVNRHINVLREQDERAIELKMVERRIMTLPSELR